MELFLLLCLPLLIALGGFIWSVVKNDEYYRINFKEFLCLVAVVAVVISLGYFISRFTATSDQEIWNGRVVKKAQEKVSCEHSYSCNPHSCMCDDKGNCSTCWDTCYEHSYDWDWALYTSNDERIEIQRIDRRGVNEPLRFSQSKISDPTALKHSYTNYIKANPWSILRRHGLEEKFKGLIPSYPINVYDYHYVNRFLTQGISISDASLWNKALMEINAELGKKKEVNIIFLVVPTKDSSYIYSLEEAWLGGKKNDLVVIFGVSEYPKIDWIRIMSWTKVEILKVLLRDELQEIGTLEKRDEIIKTVKNLVDKHFVRTRMREFKYLMAEIRPSNGAMVFLFILGIGLSIGLTVYFWREEPFE